MKKKGLRLSLGFSPSDLLGIVLMIVPFIISLNNYNKTERIIPFIPWITRTVKGMEPSLFTGILAVLFYGALIVRYGMFKKDTFIQLIISCVRFILNTWVTAALISILITEKTFALGLIRLNSAAVLALAVLTTWIGMKTFAGYSWILFLILGFDRLQEVDAAMGRAGAVFVIFFMLSMLLQVGNYTNIQDLAYDFRSKFGNNSSAIRNSINVAAGDASRRVSNVMNEKMKNIPKL